MDSEYLKQKALDSGAEPMHKCPRFWSRGATLDVSGGDAASG
jgi:hypothetical protein